MNSQNVIDPPVRAMGESRDVRGEIAFHARSLFAAKGFSKTNIIDIAKACGMSPANLYRYFRNKQAIGDAVVKLNLDEAEARVRAALAHPAASVEQRLRHFLTESVMCTVDGLRQAPRLMEIADEVFERPEGADMVEASIAVRHARLRALIEEGVAAGEFRVANPDASARAVELATRFFMAPFAIGRHGLEHVEDELRLTLDLVVAGLRAG